MTELTTAQGQVDLPSWVADYVGLPFKEHGRDRDGTDCFGLVRAVLAERFGLHLPAYVEGYASTEDAEDIARIIRGEMAPWRPVPAGAERPGDVVLTRMLNHPMHVGLVVAPGWMLHIEEGIDADLDRYDGARWRRRMIGIYRHRDLAS